MIQLYIDGKPAIIKNGTSFKLYRDNIYFTDAEDYTLDVTLPLQGCPENLAIFSAIHRPETSAVPLIGKKYPFRFIAPPLDIEGSAIVTEINATEVKVQLLAGSSVFNFDKTDAMGTDIYIDELDLGAAYDVTYPGIKYDGAGRGSLWSKIASSESLLHSTYDQSINKCVCFPIYSEGSDNMVNIHTVQNTERNGLRYLLGRDFEYFAAQPYLLLIIERVLNAIGYRLNPDNAIANSWQRHLFIANARNEYLYKRILPHWTVSEFLKEVSTFCGVLFVTKDDMVNIVRKADYYNTGAATVPIVEVVDEYTTEISEEEEGSKDARTGNVGYDFGNADPMLLLPDEVWMKAIVEEPFSSESAMRSWIASNVTDKEKSMWLFSETENNRVYAYLQNTDDEWILCEVDQAGPIIRGDKKRREIDVSLRIVPAMMKMQGMSYTYETDRGMVTKEDAIMVPMLKMDAAIDKAVDNYSVNNAINPNVEGESSSYSKPERIEVALYDGAVRNLGTYTDPTGTDVEIVVPLATGIPYVREEGVYFVELFTDSGNHKRLLLKQGIDGGMYNLLTDGKKIDTRCRHTFQFLDKIDGGTGDVFIIHSRKYACERIEYTINDNGVSPLKQGYFYEIND